MPRQRVEFAVLTLLVLCSWLTRREVQPLAVEFMAQAPSPLHEARYRQAFGLLPRFGERANRFLLSQDDLLAPIPTHNPELLALHEKLVESELDQLGQAGVGARVRHEIARLLPQGEPRREEVAAVLGLTDRTCSAACRPRAPATSNCWMTPAASWPGSTWASRATAWPRWPTCWASWTRATSFAPAADGSACRRASTGSNCVRECMR